VGKKYGSKGYPQRNAAHMSSMLCPWQCRDRPMKTGSKIFENVADFKYFETTVTYQNYINAKVEGFKLKHCYCP
jgi:hypothetical protein